MLILFFNVINRYMCSCSILKKLETAERIHKITRWEESSSLLNKFWQAAQKSQFDELKLKLLREATERQHHLVLKRKASE